MTRALTARSVHGAVPASAHDLEGIVAKRLSDPYGPRTRWLKIRTRTTARRRAGASCLTRDEEGMSGRARLPGCAAKSKSAGPLAGRTFQGLRNPGLAYRRQGAPAGPHRRFS